MTTRRLGEGFGHEKRNGSRAKSGVKFPLREKPNGGDVELVNSPKSIIGTDPSLGQYIRLHAPFFASPGSQPALSLQESESVKVMNGAIVATPKISDVQGLDASLNLGRDQLQATTDAVVSAQGEIDALEVIVSQLKVMRECGVVTLNGTTPVQVDCAFVKADVTLGTITLTDYAEGASPGRRRVEAGTTDDGVKFYVVSSDAADDGSVLWAVFA